MIEHPVILGRHHLHDTPVGLQGVDRRRHLYLLGKTGTGKSTLLFNLIVQDLLAGRGVALIDPHGSLADAVLDEFPRSRSHELVYLNPADPSHAVGFNPLDAVPTDRRHLAASHTVSAFHAIWAHSWGPSLEEILGNCVSTLLYTPGSTFLGIERLLCDGDFRQRVVARVRDPVVRSFWEKRFAVWSQSQREAKIEPVLNKLGQFLSSPLTRHILGQSRSAFDPRFMLDNRRVLIANLSKGALGEDKSNLLGALLVSSFQLAAMGRTDVPEQERRDFYLYIDEFQNFSTASFASILSEARKYRLAITCANQYLDQLPKETEAAVFGNVGSLAVFRVGRRDAERLAPEFDEEVPPQSMTDLPRYEAYVKLLVDGNERQAHRVTTYAPYRSGRTSRRETLVAQSRMRFARPRAEVEAKLDRWFARGREDRNDRASVKARPKNRTGFHLHIHLPEAETRPLRSTPKGAGHEDSEPGAFAHQTGKARGRTQRTYGERAPAGGAAIRHHRSGSPEPRRAR